MNNRLNIQDLAGLLSERTGKDRGEVERFLRDFISVVSEGVLSLIHISEPTRPY